VACTADKGKGGIEDAILVYSAATFSLNSVGLGVPGLSKSTLNGVAGLAGELGASVLSGAGSGMVGVNIRNIYRTRDFLDEFSSAVDNAYEFAKSKAEYFERMAAFLGKILALGKKGKKRLRNCGDGLSLKEIGDYSRVLDWEQELLRFMGRNPEPTLSIDDDSYKKMVEFCLGAGESQKDIQKIIDELKEIGR